MLETLTSSISPSLSVTAEASGIRISSTAPNQVIMLVLTLEVFTVMMCMNPGISDQPGSPTLGTLKRE